MDPCQEHAGMTSKEHAGMTSKEIMDFIKHYRFTALLITRLTGQTSEIICYHKVL
jgi:hypothetical protein